MNKFEEAVTEVVESPAKALENVINESEKALSQIDRPLKDARGYWHAVGPGLTTGASDDDPSGVATYSQAGAKFGYSFLWTALLTFPMMAVIQEMCARIGLATGRGLAGNIRLRYSKKVLYALTAILFVTNTANLGANLGAMSKAVGLILPGLGFFTALIMFTIVSLGLQIFVSYSGYAKFLKYLSFVLLLYIATALSLDNLPWQQIWQSAVIPDFVFSKDGFVIFTAILGTTISPFLFFWQTAQEVEERRAQGKLKISLRHHSVSHKEVRRMRFDVWVGMFFSNLVMFFIIVTCAAVLFPQGIVVSSAEEAAKALLPLAGSQAYTLFALGIIGTGLLAVPVLAGSSAYALSEAFHWGGGLSKGLRHAHAFYGVIIIGMLAGMGINFLGINPITALIWSAVLNGITAPIILYYVVSISSDQSLMGRWVNGRLSKTIGWLTIGLMSAAAIGVLVSLLR